MNRSEFITASRMCLLTSLLVFLIANLLLLDSSVLAISAVILVTAIVIQCSVFFIAVRTQSFAWGVLIVLAALLMLAFENDRSIEWLVLLAGGVLTFGYIWTCLYAERSQPAGLPLKSALIVALVIISSKSPVSFDMLYRLVDGSIHHDTLFHASIAAMIKNTGIVSTGVNGLVETPYHVLSHALIAAISKLSGVSVIESYGMVPLMLFLPLLITLFAVAAYRVADGVSYTRCYVFTALVLAITPRIFKTWGLKESYFGSESFSVALILLASLLPVLLKKRLSYSDLVLVVGVAVLSALAKAPVGLAVVGLFVARLVFFTRGTKYVVDEILMLLVSTILVSAVLLPSATAYVSATGGGATYWEYVRTSSLAGEYISRGGYIAMLPVLMFVVFHYVINWVVIRSRVGRCGLRRAMEDPAAVYSSLAVLGAVIIVAAPVLQGSAAYFFTGVAMFVSLPWFVVILARRSYARIKHPFITAFAVVLLLKFPQLLDKSVLAREAIVDSGAEQFVQRLVSLREMGGNTVLRRSASMMYASNPIPECRFKPFMYPAVSEKPWTNVMTDACDYHEYGYNAYFEVAPQGDRRLKLVLPEGYSILDV